MQNIQPIRIAEANTRVRRLLDSVNAHDDGGSNMLMTMAHSPETLESYLDFNEELHAGKLGPVLCEKVALTLAQADRSDYAMAYHTTRARRLGLGDDEIAAAREGRSPDKRTETALRYALGVARRAGDYSIVDLRKVGFGDAEIVDLIACIGLHSFTNLFNNAVRTELDFSKAEGAMTAA